MIIESNVLLQLEINQSLLIYKSKFISQNIYSLVLNTNWKVFNLKFMKK